MEVWSSQPHSLSQASEEAREAEGGEAAGEVWVKASSTTVGGEGPSWVEGVEAGVEGGEARGMGGGGVAGRLLLGMRDSTARRKSSRGSVGNVSS